VVGYKGTDYYLYLSNNGGSYAYGNLPNDNDRQAAIEERRQAIKAANTTKRMVLMISLIVLVILGIVTLIFLVGIVFLIAAIPVGIFYYPVEKEYRETKKRLEEEIRAISGEFPVIKQNFINNRVALKGVLSSVSGNPEAF
jgi:flagellar basal body-associated protein FliL